MSPTRRRTPRQLVAAARRGATSGVISSTAFAARASRRARDHLLHRTLVLHTKYWAAAFVAGAGEYADALDTGTVAAATRYRHGDDLTDEDVDRMRGRPRRPESVAFAAVLHERMGNCVRCVPGFALDVAHPTTVGLGDTFVGGFLAALAREERR